MMIKLISAVSANMVIGRDNDLIFRDKQDLAHFKESTTGQIIVMGRNTFISLNNKPLPNRENIVLSTDIRYRQELNNKEIDNLVAMPSLESVLSYKRGEDIYIIGGGQLYADTINIADELIISHFSETVEGDTFFPKIDDKIWIASSSKKYDNFMLKIYKRRKL